MKQRNFIKVIFDGSNNVKKRISKVLSLVSNYSDYEDEDAKSTEQ